MSDFPKRKPTRLKEYDYSAPGAYFITICTHNHKCILSKITTVGAIHESPETRLNCCGEAVNVGAIHESPENKLTRYGKIVDGVIKTIEDRFNIKLNTYVIMPNHIHMLILIEDDGRAIRESPLQYYRSIIDKLVGYLKMNASKKMHRLGADKKIWQRSYHDHIIRSTKDYEEIWKYIDTNVLKWEFDCFYAS